MKRILKVVVVAWLVGEWWTRGGREAVLGPGHDSVGDIDTFELWVNLGENRWDPPVVNQEIVSPDGTVIGEVIDRKYKNGSVLALGRFERAQLGWPINVAVSQAEDYTRRALLAD